MYYMTDLEYIKWLRNQIQTLADALAEKRSDISDLLNGILNEEAVDVSKIEHRFVTGYIRFEDLSQFSGKLDVFVEYDTLTTLFSWSITGRDWHPFDNEEYED